MIILSATTDSLECVSALVGASVDLDMHCSWNDYDGTTTFVPGRTNAANVTTATTTTLLAAPAGSHFRNAKTINIRNAHATLAAVVTVQFNQNATIIELHKATLLAGEALEYVEGVGFFVLGATTPPLTLVLAADHTNSTTVGTEVTGLTMAVPVGSWTFNYYVNVQTDTATTTCVKFSVNYDGTVTRFVYWVNALSSTTTASAGVIDQDVSLATGGLINTNGARAKSVTPLTAFVSIDTVNADTLYWINGLMTVTVAGNLELWFASEVDTSSTRCMAGSKLFVI